MSLSKQLFSLVSALFLLIFSLNFVLSVKNIRDYLQGEAKIHAQDTATSLGVSLTPYIANPQDPSIKSTISAIFDMGYYQEIRLVGNDNTEWVVLRSDKQTEDVPSWFIHLLPMTPLTANSEISSGWHIAGVLHVTLNPGYAYRKLYQQAKSTLNYSLAALLASMALLSLTLRVTFASLKKIDRMALAVADGHFVTIDDLPWTSEVRNVALSMNLMSRKIQGTFTALNDKLATLASTLAQDDLTGLNKKSVFENDLRRCQQDNDSAFLALIKLDSLSDMVKRKDSETIDQYLRDFARMLQKITQNEAGPDLKAYRLQGGEFALLTPHSNLNQMEGLAKNLSNQFIGLGQKHQCPDLGHIGIVPVPTTRTADQVLLAAYEACRQAQLIGGNSYFIRTSDDTARDVAAWHKLVVDCIDNGHYTLRYQQPIQDLHDHTALLEEAIVDVTDPEGQKVATGPFIAIAEKTGKIIELDRGVVHQVLNRLKEHHPPHALAVNLSLQSIKDADFRLWLAEQLKQNPAIVKRLVFNFPAHAVGKDVEAYQAFTEQLHQSGCQVMIKRFESLSLSSDTLMNLKPDYIRLARELTQGISHSQSKLDFVQTLQTLASLIDSKILAEGVTDDDDRDTLKTIGILGASR